MAKKPRSQRRKKGNALGSNGSDDRDATVDIEDDLSEDHTVADSIVTFDMAFGEQQLFCLVVDDYVECVCMCVCVCLHGYVYYLIVCFVCL